MNFPLLIYKKVLTLSGFFVCMVSRKQVLQKLGIFG